MLPYSCVALDAHYLFLKYATTHAFCILSAGSHHQQHFTYYSVKNEVSSAHTASAVKGEFASKTIYRLQQRPLPNRTNELLCPHPAAAPVESEPLALFTG